MCRVNAPRLRNLVVLFRVAASEEDKERLAETGRRERNYDASRRNFYVLKLERHSTVGSWSGGGGGAATAAPRRRRRGRKPRLERKHTLSYTVFPGSGSVIATGLRSSTDVVSALALFAHIADLATPPSSWPRRVVNSTYAGSIACSAARPIRTHRSLARYKRRMREEEEDAVSISFRPQFFPGGLVRWSDAPGSVNLFNNGNYVVVGVRREKDALLLSRRLSALIRTHWTTTTSRTSCAWTAG